MRAVPELLGAPTIGGGSARPWGGGGDVIYTFTAVRNSQKRQKNRRFRARFCLKIAENAVFCYKVLNKIYSRDVFQGIHKF
jgi:hypothetical protein